MRITIAAIALFFLGFANAQENIKYQKPSAEILQLAEFERAPSVLMDSKKEWMIFFLPTNLQISRRFESG